MDAQSRERLRARVRLTWFGCGAHRDCYKLIDHATGQRWQGICLKLTPERGYQGRPQTEAEFSVHLKRKDTVLDAIIPEVYGMGTCEVHGRDRKGGQVRWLALEQGVVTLANWNVVQMRNPAMIESTAALFDWVTALVQLLVDAAAGT